MGLSASVLSIYRRDDASHEAKYHGKRTRSVVLKMMLEKLASVKKDSRKAMDEIEASQVKTDHGLENEHAPVNPGVMQEEVYMHLSTELLSNHLHPEGNYEVSFMKINMYFTIKIWLIRELV